MLDADFPVPFETIENVYDYLRRGYDIVIPSRRHPKSRTRIPTLRRVFSFLFNVFVRILFKINVNVHGEGEHVNVLRDAFRMGVDVLKLWASLRKEKS